jgi:hypothetical protein
MNGADRGVWLKLSSQHGRADRIQHGDTEIQRPTGRKLEGQQSLSLSLTSRSPFSVSPCLRVEFCRPFGALARIAVALGLAAVWATTAHAAPGPPAADPHAGHGHGPVTHAARSGSGRYSVAAAEQAARSLAQKGIPIAPTGRLRADQPVTRGELAIILVRMIGYLENRGPVKVSRSKSPPLVSPRVRAGLAALPHRHRAYPAIAHLAKGGYLLPSDRGELFLPTARNLDQPVTAGELSAALAGIASRLQEKREALEHPGVLQEQRETVTAPGQRRGLSTPPQ